MQALSEYWQHHKMMMTYLARKGACREDAEDICHDAFLVYIERKPSLPPGQDILWLYTTCRHLYWRKRERLHSRDHRLLDDDLFLVEDAQEARIDIVKLMKSYPEIDWKLLFLLECGWTSEELAVQTGSNSSSIRSRRSRIIKSIQRQIMVSVS